MWVRSQLNHVSILSIIPNSEIIQCSQDQWDIYKLDPLYTCLVRSHPHITQITRVTNVKTAPQNSHRKRRASTPLPGSSRKKLHSGPDEHVVDASGENESPIDEMIVDPLPHSNTMDGFHGTSMPEGHHPEKQSSESQAQEASETLPADTRDTKKRKRMLIHYAWMISDVLI